MSETIAIFGATSAIAEHVARIYAARSARLVLLGRSESRLQSIASDLQARGASSVRVMLADLSESDSHAQLIDSLYAQESKVDVALIAYGTLGDETKTQFNFEAAVGEFRSNFLSQVSLLIELSKRFEAAGAGSLAVITSVAGDRGRKSNYTYGTAKGALSLYLQGVRNRLASKGVHVCTIKPGFVDTPMTSHLKKGPLFASPEAVAKGIVRAIEKKRDVVYLPCFWRLIMAIIRAIPECIFKKTSI